VDRYLTDSGPRARVKPTGSTAAKWTRGLNDKRHVECPTYTTPHHTTAAKSTQTTAAAAAATRQQPAGGGAAARASLASQQQGQQQAQQQQLMKRPALRPLDANAVKGCVDDGMT